MHRVPAPPPPRRREDSLGTRFLEVVFALLVLALFLLLIAFCPGVSRAAATPDACEPPRTRVALYTLVDATDHAWEAWTGSAPGPLVTRMLADSLRTRGREVAVLANPDPNASRPIDDVPALEHARASDAEIVVTGRLEELLLEDRREGGKLWRWGVGAPDTRSRARVRVVLRALDARDGSVIIETMATRERAGRATAVVDRNASPSGAPAPDAILGQALGEALSDLVRTIGLRIEARGQGHVVSVEGDACWLDVGAKRGHFEGQRLEVWRAGIETYDENLVRLGEESRVGVLVVTSTDGHGHVRARRVEGDVMSGDRIRACSGAVTPALSLRRP